MDRSGVCLSCHKEIPDESLASSFLHHVAKYTGQLPKTPKQHSALLHKVLMTNAAAQFCLPLGLAVVTLLGILWWIRIRRRRRARNAP